MASALAAAALGVLMTGAGPTGSPAEAAIAPEEWTGAVQFYRIPEAPLSAALNALADQNGLRLSYDALMTRGMRARGLLGRYNVKDALQRLLGGTGLTYRLAGDGRTVSILLAQNDTDAQSDAGAIELPAVEVTATQGAPGGGGGGTGCGEYGGAPCSGFGGAGLAQDPYNTSYVLPDVYPSHLKGWR